MISRLKSLSWLPLIALVFGSLWAYYSYDIIQISQRTSVTTSVKDSKFPEFQELAKQIDFEEYNAEHHQLTPPVLEDVELAPEAPEERIPGTTLSEKMLTDMLIEAPIHEEQIFFTAATPNDPIYPQWYTNSISAPTAWDETTGSSTTLVAVIDTGYALDHEDLSTAWFINSGEQGNTQSGDTCWTGSVVDKQTNGCDDDSNGFVDDWRGWDFSNDDNNPQAGDNSVSGANHGTKSAGLVGARSDNNVGVASINWNTQILPLQSLFDEGYGYSSDISAAIYYAVEMGADVINMSLGGPYPDSYTAAAVKYAQQNNVIVVTSSGNCGLNQSDAQCVGFASPGGMGYPARYSETIAVGATTSSDLRASFSSYGPELNIVAPGSGSIQTPSWSTANETSLYATSSYGTSFSAPIVAGAVALLREQYPTLSTDETIALFQNSADKVAGMGSDDWHTEYGFGRLNVQSLLDQLDEYQKQLAKGAPSAQADISSAPQISSNSGHNSSSSIGGSTTVTTYCLADPGQQCVLTLDKRNSSADEVFDAVRTNNQGIAIFEWTGSDASSGTFDAYVTVNSQNSPLEPLIIQ